MLYYNNLTGNTQSNQQLSDRIPSLDSVDLALDARGELLVDRLGSLTTVNAGTSIVGNLIRRVSTPAGGYERLAFTNGGLYELVDVGWSDPLIDRLSAPLTPAFTEWALARLADITAKDSRLTILSIGLVDASPLHISIEYTLNEQPITNLTIPLPQEN